MAQKQQSLGREGEALACQFLQKKGYEIIERNYRFRKSEIDIIVKDGTTLVFVEVKLRTHRAYGYPEQFVSEAQMESIRSASEIFTDTYVNYKRIRFDIIAIEKYKNTHVTTHFVDAF